MLSKDAFPNSFTIINKIIYSTLYWIFIFHAFFFSKKLSEKKKKNSKKSKIQKNKKMNSSNLEEPLSLMVD